MKKILFTICLLGCLGWVTMTLALTENRDNSIDINATIPGGGVPPCPPNCPPPQDSLVIDQVSVVGLCNSAVASWHTSLSVSKLGANSTGAVVYWPALEISNRTQVDSSVAQEYHQLILDNLSPLTDYGLEIKAYSGALYASLGVFDFTTSCNINNASIVAQPQERGVKVTVVYPNDPDISRVVIRKKFGSAPTGQSDGEDFFTDNQSKPALSEETFFDPFGSDPYQRDYTHFSVLGQDYCYTVFVCNGYNACSSGAYDCARRLTKEAVDFSAVGANQRVELAWQNPADEASQDFYFSRSRLIRVTGDCASAGISDGQVLVEGVGQGFVDNNLKNDQTYYYKLFTKNSYGEYSDGLCLSATPSVEAEARCVNNVKIDNGDRRVDVAWVNPVNESGVFTLDGLLWQRSGSCVNSASEGNNVYSGLGQSFSDSQVENDTTYNYTNFVSYNGGSVVRCGCFTARPSALEQPPIIEVCPDCAVVEDKPVVNFFVNQGSLEIPPVQQRIDVLADYEMLIKLERDSLAKPIDYIVAQVAGKNYFFDLDGSQKFYQTAFRSPASPGSAELLLTIVYQDKTKSQQTLTLIVWPRGAVYSDSKEKLAGVKLSLLKAGGLLTVAGAVNPQDSDLLGTYGWMVPNGDYELLAEKNGYESQKIKLAVKNNIVNQELTLKTIKTPLESILDQVLPPARQANNYAAPAVAAVALINVAVAVPWWNFFYYLQYLFTEPLAWLFRRRRQGWGVVFNSITKKPVDLAVVRLYDRVNQRLLRSKVTDKQGRYNFLVGQGVYYMEVSKAGFVFPSEILKKTDEDSVYTDIYHGQDLVIKDDREGVIIANIPLDQEEARLTDNQVIRRDFWRQIRENVSLVSPILAVASFIISPTMLIGGFAVLHLLLFLLFRRLAHQDKPRPWGVIYDQDNRKSLGKSVVRIFSPEYNRMLEAQVADNYGRYGFLVDNNVYYLTANKDGYSENKSDTINLIGKKSSEVIGQDLPLVKANEAAKEATNVLTSETTAGPIQEVQAIAPEKEKSELEEMKDKIDALMQAEAETSAQKRREIIKEDERG